MMEIQLQMMVVRATALQLIQDGFVRVAARRQLIHVQSDPLVIIKTMQRIRQHVSQFEATVSKLALKSEMTATQVTMMDAKATDQASNQAGFAAEAQPLQKIRVHFVARATIKTTLPIRQHVSQNAETDSESVLKHVTMVTRYQEKAVLPTD